VSKIAGEINERTAERLKQQLEMAEAIIAADGALITGLKNDLAAALAACKAKDEALNAIATTGVIREAKWCGMSAKDIAELALAATDDLDGLILCHAEPCRDDGRCQYAIDHGAEGLGHCLEGKCYMPLYRAWEPKT